MAQRSGVKTRFALSPGHDDAERDSRISHIVMVGFTLAMFVFSDSKKSPDAFRSHPQRRNDKEVP